MYPGCWLTLDGILPHDWVRGARLGGIREVALEMAEVCGIRDGDCIVGSSLGGMVACEISKIRHIPKLFLVGSALRKEEISRVLAAVRPLAAVVPIGLVKRFAGMMPGEHFAMFSAADPLFVRSMCRAVFEWEGGFGSRTEVLRIHGRHDLVIPAPSQVDLLLDGGHLISMTHADQCVGFIRSRRSVGSKSS